MTEQMTQEADAKQLGLDPLMERSLGELVRSIPKRCITMVTKVLSLKGLVFATATYLLANNAIETWAWVLVTLVLIFGEKALQYLKDIRG